MPQPIGALRAVGTPEKFPDFIQEAPKGQDVPGIREDRYSLWAPAQGVDYSKPPSQIEPGFASFVKGLHTRRGRYVLTPGLSEYGSGMTEAPKHIGDHVDSAGNRYAIAVSQNKLWVSMNGVWTGINLVVPARLYDLVDVTSFGNYLIIAKNNGRLEKWDPTASAFLTVTELSATAARSAFVMNFGQRVVAVRTIDATGVIQPFTVAWTVANSSIDWTGLGSGSETLLNAPDGEVDQLTGAQPMTEDVALLLRERSLWHMERTGIGLTPFRFSRRVPGIGTITPFATKMTPIGVIFVSEEDIMLYTLDSLVPIGEQVRNRILDNITKHSISCAAYDIARQLYKLLIPDVGLFCFNIVERAWTEEDPPANASVLGSVIDPASGGTIDSLAGTIDDLAGTIDDLGGGVGIRRLFLYGHSTGTKKADAAVFPAVDIRTGALLAADPESDVTIDNLKLKYKASGNVTITVDSSVDGGSSWQSYGTFSLVSTSKSLWAVITKVLHGFEPMFRLTASAPANYFEILTLMPHVVEGETNAR